MEARIIVIDNNEQLRHLLMLSLESQGYQVFSYSYADVDLAALEQHQPDLVFLDFNPSDDGIGWQFLQALKMDDTTAKISILITTIAFELSAEVKSYLLSRYIRVVQKPFDFEAVLTLVQQTLTQASQANIIFSSDRLLPILVVDDTEDLREGITMVLRLEGYEVVTAYNGLVALDAVSRAEHCLILLDIAMPIMNGFEFLTAYERQLRPHSPVIIVSGEADIRSYTLPVFVVDVISKPFEIKSVLRWAEKYAQRV